MIDATVVLEAHFNEHVAWIQLRLGDAWLAGLHGFHLLGGNHDATDPVLDAFNLNLAQECPLHGILFVTRNAQHEPIHAVTEHREIRCWIEGFSAFELRLLASFTAMHVSHLLHCNAFDLECDRHLRDSFAALLQSARSLRLCCFFRFAF